MILFLIFIIIGLINCSVPYKDCASEPSIQMGGTMIPHPAIYPRDVELNFTLRFLKDIPLNNTKLKVLLKKVSPKRLNIGCILGYGSCLYDYCRLWKFLYGLTPDKTLIPECPSKTGEYHYENIKVVLPKGYLIYFIKSFIKGDYSFEATVLNEVSKEVYGCTQANFTINLESNYKWDNTDEPFIVT